MEEAEGRFQYDVPVTNVLVMRDLNQNLGMLLDLHCFRRKQRKILLLLRIRNFGAAWVAQQIRRVRNSLLGAGILGGP